MLTAMANQDVKIIFESTEFGRLLNEEQVSRVIDASEVRLLKKGDVLCKSGDKLSELHLVLSGSIRAELTNGSEQEILGFLNAGQPIGFLMLSTKSRQTLAFTQNLRVVCLQE